MPIRSEKIFTDIPLNLDVHPITGDLLRITNNNAVIQSVKNLVLTNYYERFFQPRLGSSVTDYLFENFDPITEENIEGAIEDVIRNYEPRVDLIAVNVSSNPDQHRFTTSIIFRVVNEIDPVEIDVFLDRIR